MAHVRKAWALAFMLLAAAHPRAQDGIDREYRIKAVFLFHFTQFVTWPENAFPAKESPLVVGILGDDPFDAYLEEVVRGEKVKDHPLVVKRYSRIEDIKACHILFVSAAEARKRGQVADALKGRNILTVGESESFCRQGGMVCFLDRAGKIRLEINLEAAKAGDLTFSSKLLSLADVLPAGKE